MKNKKIIVDNLYVTKKEASILKNINLQLVERKSYLLYGRNGAGKSTLIKCLVGLEEEYQGDIKLFLNKEEVYRLSYLPEDLSVSDQLRVKEYIHSFILLYKDMTVFNQNIYQKFSKLFEIRNYENKMFGGLSKGMKKMVLLCISLMKEADVLVLDEPFEGLDIIIKEKLTRFLLDEADNGKILLISSHEIAEVYENFDFIIAMKGGEITGIIDSKVNIEYQELLAQI